MYVCTVEQKVVVVLLVVAAGDGVNLVSRKKMGVSDCKGPIALKLNYTLYARVVLHVSNS